MPYRKKRLDKPVVSMPQSKQHWQPQRVFQPVKRQVPGAKRRCPGLYSFKSRLLMAEHKAEKFSSFTQWLSGRLNLPADTVAKTILLIPPDERRDIKNLRQWRIQVNKYS